MTLMNRITNSAFRGVFRATCKLDKDELNNVPEHGPMIIITNHINVLEGPMLYLFMRPRNTIAMAKQELWKHGFTKKIMEWWECIPVNRGMLDREAMNACFKVLDDEDILCIAPEGTRSPDGRLKQGKAGSGFIAAKKRVPILPIANFGMENYMENLKHFKKTRVSVRVGKPFEICLDKNRLSPDERQGITDEMMIRLARLMPDSYHGYYAGMVDRPLTMTRTVTV